MLWKRTVICFVFLVVSSPIWGACQLSIANVERVDLTESYSSLNAKELKKNISFVIENTGSASCHYIIKIDQGKNWANDKRRLISQDTTGLFLWSTTYENALEYRVTSADMPSQNDPAFPDALKGQIQAGEKKTVSFNIEAPFKMLPAMHSPYQDRLTLKVYETADDKAEIASADIDLHLNVRPEIKAAFSESGAPGAAALHSSVDQTVDLGVLDESPRKSIFLHILSNSRAQLKLKQEGDHSGHLICEQNNVVSTIPYTLTLDNEILNVEDGASKTLSTSLTMVGREECIYAIICNVDFKGGKATIPGGPQAGDYQAVITVNIEAIL